MLIVKKGHITFDLGKAVLGVLLAVAGVLSPIIFPESMLHIASDLQQAVRQLNEGYLLVAALNLIVLNSLRCIPLYLGTFLMIQSFTIDIRSIHTMKNIVFSAVLIPSLYALIAAIFDIRFEFAIPALLSLSILLVVDRLDLSTVNIFKKLLILSTMVIAFQCLDAVPWLKSAYFGTGEYIYTIHHLADILNAENYLSCLELIFFTIMALFTFLMSMQISVEHQLRTAKKQVEDEREKLVSARMRLLDARISKEQQFLVHDLKAPLTSMQIWVDVLRMNAEQAGRKDCDGYFDHIDQSIKQMNTLISEILNPKVKNIFKVSDIVKVFSAQTSPSRYASILSVNCLCPDTIVEVNRTNLVRALINLADNASHAITHDHGKITVTVTRQEDQVFFSVKDNGCGIAPELLDKVWELGVSGRESSGVGMFFVKTVVEEAGGKVMLQSRPRVGTEVTLKIPVAAE